MGIHSNAYAYEQAQSYERRQIEVLDGKKAKAREEARRADVVKIVFGVSAVFIYLLVVAFVGAKICNVGVEINSLKAQIEDTENMIARAELEIGKLASLDRIESYAISNLGMVYPEAEDIHLLDEQSSLKIAQGNQAISTATAEAEAATEEESSFWQDVTNFLTGTANAAEN